MTSRPKVPAARRGDARVAWLLVSPAVVGFGAFYGFPLVRGVYLSFTEFHVLTPPRWVGLANFRQLFGDEVFWHSLEITVYFVLLQVAIGTVVSLAIAAVLHRLTRSALLRGVILLPYLISNMIAALVWQWMLDPQLGIAPTVLGPDGRTRSVLSNSNGNNIWAGTSHPDLAWKWVSYMGSEECQTMASRTGTFFPSIEASMAASATALKQQGIDLSVFTQALRDGVLYPSVVYGNGAELQSVMEPLLEQYFAHQRDADVFAEMARKSEDILAKVASS